MTQHTPQSPTPNDTETEPTRALLRTIMHAASGPITHEGQAGVTLTGQRDGDAFSTLIEYAGGTPAEFREILMSGLCLFDELLGEAFIASVFARYAEETGKKFFQKDTDGGALVIIHGGKQPLNDDTAMVIPEIAPEP